MFDFLPDACSVYSLLEVRKLGSRESINQDATCVRSILAVTRTVLSSCTGRNLAICVGNSQPALLSWFMEQPQTSRLLLTDAHMAGGVLEGISRHGLF